MRKVGKSSKTFASLLSFFREFERKVFDLSLCSLFLSYAHFLKFSKGRSLTSPWVVQVGKRSETFASLDLFFREFEMKVFDLSLGSLFLSYAHFLKFPKVRSSTSPWVMRKVGKSSKTFASLEYFFREFERKVFDLSLDSSFLSYAHLLKFPKGRSLTSP